MLIETGEVNAPHFIAPSIEIEGADSNLKTGSMACVQQGPSSLAAVTHH